MPRPKGSKNLKPYPKNAATLHQRTVAPLKSGKYSKFVQNVIEKQGLTPQETEVLSLERQELWKKMQTPVIMLMDEYVDLKTLIQARQLSKDGEILGKDVLSASKLLLDISKEINRLTQVTNKDKFEAYTRSFSESDELEFEVVTDVTEGIDNE